MAETKTNTLAEVEHKLKSKLEELFADKLVHVPSLAWKEYGLCFGVKRENAKSVFRDLRDNPDFQMNMLVDVTCVDWLDKKEPRFDVVYQLLSIKFLHRLTIKIEVEEADPEVDSVVDLWNSANFMEREAWDMFGVRFVGHGDLRRILLYDEFVGHPLRKDYPKQAKQPRIPLRIPEQRNTSMNMARPELVNLPYRQGKLG